MTNKLLGEGLAELKKAVQIHKRDILRIHGGTGSWKRETKKLLKPATVSLSAAGVLSSPAVSVLAHGNLRPSTMAAVAAGSIASIPIMGSLVHLKQIAQMHHKLMQMKKRHKLTEAYHTTVSKSPYSGGVETDIYKNPSRTELHKLLHQSEFKTLRGLLGPENDGHNVYVWDAGRAPHFVVEDELNMRGHLKVNFFKWKDGNIHISQEYYPDTRIIENHPWVKKTLPNVRVFHS